MLNREIVAAGIAFDGGITHQENNMVIIK